MISKRGDLQWESDFLFFFSCFLVLLFKFSFLFLCFLDFIYFHFVRFMSIESPVVERDGRWTPFFSLIFLSLVGGEPVVHLHFRLMGIPMGRVASVRYRFDG